MARREREEAANFGREEAPSTRRVSARHLVRVSEVPAADVAASGSADGGGEGEVIEFEEEEQVGMREGSAVKMDWRVDDGDTLIWDGVVVKVEQVDGESSVGISVWMREDSRNRWRVEDYTLPADSGEVWMAEEPADEREGRLRAVLQLRAELYMSNIGEWSSKGWKQQYARRGGDWTVAQIWKAAAEVRERRKLAELQARRALVDLARLEVPRDLDHLRDLLSEYIYRPGQPLSVKFTGGVRMCHCYANLLRIMSHEMYLLFSKHFFVLDVKMSDRISWLPSFGRLIEHLIILPRAERCMSVEEYKTELLAPLEKLTEEELGSCGCNRGTIAPSQQMVLITPFSVSGRRVPSLLVATNRTVDSLNHTIELQRGGVGGSFAYHVESDLADLGVNFPADDLVNVMTGSPILAHFLEHMTYQSLVASEEVVADRLQTVVINNVQGQRRPSGLVAYGVHTEKQGVFGFITDQRSLMVTNSDALPEAAFNDGTPLADHVRAIEGGMFGEQVGAAWAQSVKNQRCRTYTWLALVDLWNEAKVCGEDIKMETRGGAIECLRADRGVPGRLGSPVGAERLAAQVKRDKAKLKGEIDGSHWTVLDLSCEGRRRNLFDPKAPNAWMICTLALRATCFSSDGGTTGRRQL